MTAIPVSSATSIVFDAATMIRAAAAASKDLNMMAIPLLRSSFPWSRRPAPAVLLMHTPLCRRVT
jgi:hypothetical protein